jgi:hypothetical protein
VLIALFIGQPQFVFNEMQLNEYDIPNELGEKKGDEILIVHCCFSISQNELKF